MRIIRNARDARGLEANHILQSFKPSPKSVATTTEVMNDEHEKTEVPVKEKNKGKKKV